METQIRLKKGMIFVARRALNTCEPWAEQRGDVLGFFL